MIYFRTAWGVNGTNGLLTGVYSPVNAWQKFTVNLGISWAKFSSTGCSLFTLLCAETRTEYLAAHSSSLKVVIGEAFLETMPGLDSGCQHSIPRGKSWPIMPHGAVNCEQNLCCLTAPSATCLKWSVSCPGLRITLFILTGRKTHPKYTTQLKSPVLKVSNVHTRKCYPCKEQDYTNA